ncbi:MAG: hypothetical protein Q7T04_00405, partial [Dehalococcoidia bacterium]|nr:hypothetical protein [Dehalococcoidia bacterium]
MTSENELERRFSENIDRLLAGEAVEADPSVADDTRTAQAFAQKMIALRGSPSAQFQAQLKARLLNTLNAESARRPAWYERVWPRRGGWQVAIALALLMVVIGIVGVRTLYQPPVPVQVAGAYFAISAKTDEPVYRPGEQVRISVTMKNVTPEPIEMEQFPPILSLMRAETRQPVYTFIQGKAAHTLAPEQSVTFQVIWDQRDDKGRMSPAGAYYLELEDLDYQGQSLKLDL